MTTTTAAPVLEIKRILDATPARVFDAWLNHEQFQAWIGPEGVTCEVPLHEPRIGGRYRIIMHLFDGRVIPVAGVFKAIDPPTRLSFTWGWENEARQTLVTVTLRDLGGRTELTLRHDGLPTAEDRDGHGRGWNSALNKLVAQLAQMGKP